MKGQYTDALASLQDAVKLDPDQAGIWSNLGLAFAGVDQFKKAEECWKKALKLDPHWTDARANLGALYLKEKNPQKAEWELKKVLDDLTYANAAQARFNLALVYSLQHKPLEEEQQLKLAVKSDDGYCPAWFRLGKLQKDKGELQEAQASFQKAVSGVCFKNPEAHYEIGTLYIKEKNVTKARSKLLEVIQLFPESEWAQKAEATLSAIR
jgi:Flp pilus assembly protein TadD